MNARDRIGMNPDARVLWKAGCSYSIVDKRGDDPRMEKYCMAEGSSASDRG
jgi:hypothetical protein